MDEFINAILTATFGSVGLLLMMLAFMGFDRLVRIIRERHIIAGKLDQHMRQRLEEFVRREP